MTEENVLTNRLVSVLAEHSLGELAAPIEQLTNGWTNLTYKFRTKPSGKAYILRQYRPGSLRDLSLSNIQFELKFLTYLHAELHLPVAPVIDPPGIFALNAENYCALFPFIEGVKFLDTPATATRELWQTLEMSRFIGTMHSNIVTRQFELASATRRSVNFIEVKYKLVHNCDAFKLAHPELYRRIRVITDQYTASIPLLGARDEQDRFLAELERHLPVGYIHADTHDDNVLFDAHAQKLAAVLDFDDMYIGPLLIDVAMVVCLWCSVGSQVQWEYVCECLRVYQKARGLALTEEEWNLLEIYCYLTILNQVLFTIEAEECAKPMEEMLTELLLPIEQIGAEGSMCSEKLRRAASV